MEEFLLLFPRATTAFLRYHQPVPTISQHRHSLTVSAHGVKFLTATGIIVWVIPNRGLVRKTFIDRKKATIM